MGWHHHKSPLQGRSSTLCTNGGITGTELGEGDHLTVLGYRQSLMENKPEVGALKWRTVRSFRQ